MIKLSHRVNLTLVFVLLLSAVALNAGASVDVPGRPAALDKVDPLVLGEIAAAGRADFFLWLTEQADLSPAAALQTKEAKGAYVFETLLATAERTQRPLRQTLDGLGANYRPFYVANMILVRDGSYDLLLSLAARPEVASILPNRPYQLQEPYEMGPDPGAIAAVESNITFIKADQVWALGYDGAGTVMAAGDTGLQWNHPAIIDHYRGWDGATADHNYNWWDATGTYPTVPGDGHGHGTHVTGTMVGDDGGANQIGVAPGAQAIHCKNMTNSGSGSDATFNECFEWILAPWDLNGNNPNPALAPHSMNNSWGYWGGGQNQFRTVINNLQAAGVVIEVSAGNEGSSCGSLRSPGDYHEVLTTGSVNHTSAFPGIITGFSSRGPSSLDPGYYFPDIMAPGQNIRSSLPGNTYASWSGTSMAGPHAAALVGLMWSACPPLTGFVEETIAMITDTAVPLTGQGGSSCGGDYVDGPNHDWGHGTIDALAAVQAALAQCGGLGALDGTVSDGLTADPIAGAAVTVERLQGGQWSLATDAGGYYTRTLPVGTLTVTVAAYGYETAVAAGVEVITDTVTTQDFSLTPSAHYLVSGVVTQAGTGYPLLAQVEVLGAPVDPVLTDPATGYYEVTVAAGTYTWWVTADLHQPAQREVVVDGDKTEDFALLPLPCVLLVDDDNDAPDVRPYYTAALDALGVDYDVFDVGGGAGNGPTLDGMLGYQMVIWFSGDKWGSSAGPNGTDEAALAAYLDAGGRLFLSSQDYLYDWGLTPFGQTYLGIGSYTNDQGNATAKHGVAGDPIGDGLGPYPLTYPAGFSDYGDIVSPGAGASLAFRSQTNNDLDIDHDGGAWRTVFFGTSWVPIHNASPANGEEVLGRIIEWFGGCGCEAPEITDLSSDGPVELGAPLHLVVEASGTAPLLYAWAMNGPGYGSGLNTPTPVMTYTAAGVYTPTVTVTNGCGSDAGELVVAVTCDAPEAAFVSNSPVTVGEVMVFTTTVTGTPPFVYTWEFGDGAVAIGPGLGVISYTYPSAGHYTVTLTVENPCGMDQTSRPVIVEPDWRYVFLPLIQK